MFEKYDLKELAKNAPYAAAAICCNQAIAAGILECITDANKYKYYRHQIIENGGMFEMTENYEIGYQSQNSYPHMVYRFTARLTLADNGLIEAKITDINFEMNEPHEVRDPYAPIYYDLPFETEDIDLEYITDFVNAYVNTPFTNFYDICDTDTAYNLAYDLDPHARMKEAEACDESDRDPDPD